MIGFDATALALVFPKLAKKIVKRIAAYNSKSRPTLVDLKECREGIAAKAFQIGEPALDEEGQEKVTQALGCLQEAFDAEENVLIGREVLETNNFRVNSSLTAYEKVLGTPFTKALAGMGEKNRWLDGGAGEANAMIEYLEQGGKGQCTAAGFEIPSGAKGSVADAIRRFEGRFFYASGKLFSAMDQSDLHGGVGDFDLITDLNGVLYYTETPARDLEKYLLLLKPDGVLIFTANCLIGSTLDAPNAKPGAGGSGLLRWTANVYGTSLVRYQSSSSGADFCVMKRVGDEVKAPELELTRNAWRQQRPAYVFRCVHTLPNDINSLVL
jgi:SAM-dependent methyltransferase